MSTKSLFDDFNPVSAKEWKQKIQFDLKGADYNESLVWESPEGIKVKPFYHSNDAIKSSSIGSSSGWKIGHPVYAGNAKLANRRAKKKLEKGAESICFTIPSQKIKISELFEGIVLEETKVFLKLEFIDLSYVNSIASFLEKGKENIHLNIDIIGNLARSGNWYKNLEKDHVQLDEILQLDIPNTITVDTGIYQNAGANMVQQLAYAMAHANEYLNHFKDKKGQRFTFKVAVSTNYFFEIAKLRALRKLWSVLAKEYDFTKSCHLVTEPSKRNKTLYDYNTNMLRTITESMSAVLGGADTIFNMPYDAIYHKNNEFGDRIALNQLLLLKNESYFDKVNNPSDGAYYIEELTNQLAEKALELFKQIEKGGGFLKQLRDGIIQKKIKESAAKEQQNFNDGAEVLVGTNKYVNETDKMKDTIELYPFVKKNSRKTIIQPIIGRRLSEELEQNRLKDE